MQKCTNGGSIDINKKYIILDLRDGCFKKDMMTNIIGLRYMRNKYWVTYSLANKPAFEVHIVIGRCKS